MFKLVELIKSRDQIKPKLIIILKNKKKRKRGRKQ